MNLGYKIHLKSDTVHNKQKAFIIIIVDLKPKIAYKWRLKLKVAEDSFGIKRLRWLISHFEKSLNVSLGIHLFEVYHFLVSSKKNQVHWKQPQAMSLVEVFEDFDGISFRKLLEKLMLVTWSWCQFLATSDRISILVTSFVC